jgi:hypothetical protein
VSRHAPVRARRGRDPEAIDLFLTEEDVRRALEDCPRDEPQWRGLLRVEKVELAGAAMSQN